MCNLFDQNRNDMKHRIFQYFDINSKIKQFSDEIPQTYEPNLERSNFRWLPQWLAIIVSLLLHPFLEAFKESGIWGLGQYPLGALWSGLFALIVFPALYKNIIETQKPNSLVVFFIFITGLGWQELFGIAICLF